MTETNVRTGEAALPAAERLQALLEGIADSVTVQDRQGNIVYANEAAARMLGVESVEALLQASLGDAIKKVRLLDEDGTAAGIDSLPGRQVLAGAPSAEAVIRWRLDGEADDRWSNVRARPLLDSKGRVQFVVNTFRDITKQKRAERELQSRLQQQATVSRLGLLALQDVSLDVLFEDATRSVAETLGVEYSKILELLPDGEALLLRAGVGWHEGLVGSATVGARDGSQAGYTLRAGWPVIVQDLSVETRFTGPAFLLDHGVVSGISVIIGGKQGPWGVLGAHTSRRRDFIQQDVDFLQSVANVLAAAIQRREDEEAINFRTTLLDAVGQAVFATDLDGQITHWNRAAERLSGWTAEEALGRRLRELVTFERRSGERPSFRERILSGETWSGELRIERRDGSSFPGLLNAGPLHTEDGRVVGITGVVVDMSEQQAAQHRIAVQYSISRVLAESESIEAAAGELLREIGEGLDWDVGAFWRLEPVDDCLACVDVWQRPEIGDYAFVEASRRTRLPLGQGLPGRVWQSGEAEWIADLGPDPNFPRYPAARDIGLRSGFAVPVRLGGLVLGVIEFFSRESRPVDQELIRVMSAVGGNTGHFMERRRAQAALREEEQRYRRLVELSPEPILVHQEGVLVFANLAAARLLGANSTTELVGRPMLDLVAPEHRGLVQERIEHVLQRGTEVDLVEERFVRLDGSVIDVEVVGMPTVYEHRPAYQAMIRDITERKRAEEALMQAEEKYRSIFENSLFGIFQTTREGRFLSANPALARMFGYDSPEEIVGGVTDIGLQIHADPARRALFARTLEERGEVAGFEATAYRRDGTRLEIALTGRLLRDGAGDIIGYEGMVEDITLRKRAEEELREQKLILETSEQVGTMLAAELDLGKTAQSVIDAAVSLTGASIGVFFYEAPGEGERGKQYSLSGVSPEVFESMAIPVETPFFAPVLEGRGVVRVDDVAANERFGQQPPFFGLPSEHPPVRSFLGVPVFYRSGQVLGGLFFGHPEAGVFGDHQESLALRIARWAGIAVDNASLYRQAQEAQEVLRKTNESKDEFLSVMSHELRTPITTIYGGARLLQSRGTRMDDNEREDVLSDIERESERLYRLVEDLLALSRLEFGETVVPRPVALDKVVDKVVTAFRRRRPSRQIDIEVPPGTITQGDITYTEQVLRNLLSNADKYSPADRPVVIRAVQEGDEVRISVLDEGAGISADEAEVIFERFYRSDRTAKQAGGVGVGLTVCKRLVEAQGGSISAAARPERGLEITFTLPAWETDEA